MWAAAASETTTSNGFVGGWEWAEINQPVYSACTFLHTSLAANCRKQQLTGSQTNQLRNKLQQRRGE
jgi:hypothetical protein